MTEDEAKQIILDNLQSEVQDQVKVLSKRFLRHDTRHEESGREEYRK